MKRCLSAITSLLLVSGIAWAADAPPTTDWAPNEVVVVSAQAPGPAFWHLKKGDSEIWILGTPGPLPENLSWNATHLADVITGARAVLLPPLASAGFFEVSWFLITNHSLLSMPDDQKLEDTLPPELHARFVAARGSIKRDADRYDDDPPIIAAVKLQGDFEKANHFSREEPRRTVEKIARAKHVPVHNVAEYGALAMVKEFLRLPMAAQKSCLENAVSDVEARAVHGVPAAEAWAVGDLKGIKAHYSSSNLEKCAKGTQSFSKLHPRAVADSLAAIDDALSKPGKTVMLADIGSLLRSEGVAQKLREQGVIIEGPAE
jgi:hypothetical protein